MAHPTDPHDRKRCIRRASQRLVDLAVAITALLLLAPVLLLVVLAIKLESRGPVCYVSKRVGRKYQVFRLYKFRTMYPDADRRLKELAHLNQYQERVSAAPTPCPSCERRGRLCSPMLVKDGAILCEHGVNEANAGDESSLFFKIQNDPRVTRVGRLLRKTSIDELPQLLNVIKGDMSLVGNRPLPLYEAQQLTTDHAIARFLAPAGLTGLWQVTKRGAAEMNAAERIELDTRYAHTHTFSGDLRIMLRTIPALLQSKQV